MKLFGQLILEFSNMLRQVIIKMRFGFGLWCVGVYCAHKVLSFEKN